MNNLKIKTIEVEIPCGKDITWACERACRMAKDANAAVRFYFNDVLIEATPEAAPDEMENEYHETATRRNLQERATKAYHERSYQQAVAELAQFEKEIAARNARKITINPAIEP